MGVRGVQWGVLLGTVCVAVQPTLGSSSSCVGQRAPISPGLPAHCGTPPIDLGALDGRDYVRAYCALETLEYDDKSTERPWGRRYALGSHTDQGTGQGGCPSGWEMPSVHPQDCLRIIKGLMDAPTFTRDDYYSEWSGYEYYRGGKLDLRFQWPMKVDFDDDCALPHFCHLEMFDMDAVGSAAYGRPVNHQVPPDACSRFNYFDWADPLDSGVYLLPVCTPTAECCVDCVNAPPSHAPTDAPTPRCTDGARDCASGQCNAATGICLPEGQCNAGHHGAYSSGEKCRSCPAGRYAATPGQRYECTACPVFWGSNDDFTACQLCPLGQILDTANQECKSVPQCINGARDGGETDTDCGGTQCAPCEVTGQTCCLDRDCLGSRTCAGAACDGGGEGTYGTCTDPAPTDVPTNAPSSPPSVAPTGRPSASPTHAPTGTPSSSPSVAPTGVPTGAPTYDVNSACELTVTGDDTDPHGWGYTHVLWIESKAQLDALAASVEDCVDADGWRLKGGGLYIISANDVADLEALSGLVGIDGKDGKYGSSLYIGGNANLESLAGLRNLQGTLPGALHVDQNNKLKSLAGLEHVARIEGPDNGYSLVIENNDALCLTTADRARLTDGTALTIAGPGHVQAALEPSAASQCVSCPGRMFSVANGDPVYTCLAARPTHAPTDAPTSTSTAEPQSYVQRQRVHADDTSYLDLRISLQGHTIDPAGGEMVFHIVDWPQNGILWVSGTNDGPTGINGTWYEPNVGFLGSDSFTYTATDARGVVSAPATVHIMVATDSPSSSPSVAPTHAPTVPATDCHAAIINALAKCKDWENANADYNVFARLVARRQDGSCYLQDP